jgi:hypothetical protein
MGKVWDSMSEKSRHGDPEAVAKIRKREEWPTTRPRPSLYSVIMRTVVAFIAVLFGYSAAFGQLVCTGDACSCENEKTPPPNFSVSQSVHVTGKLVAESGYPFVFENTVVQVRTPKEKRVLVTATVDSLGQFDLGIIPAGEYRLIAARRLQNGKLGRQPLADQPKAMSCSGVSNCSITAVQHLHGTDLPFEFCPPL